MLDRMLTPEELIELDKIISANADEVIAKGFTKPKRSDAKILYNDLKEGLSVIYNHSYVNEVSYPVWLDDLVTGASRMNTHSNKSLNRGSILKILGCLDEITSASIAWKLKVDERTAREYFSCIRVIYPKLLLHVEQEVKLIDEDVGDLFSE